MGRIIAVANQKGGVGKTTTTINLSAALAGLGMEVLVVDCDPQGNATTGLGLSKKEIILNEESTSYDLMTNDAPAEECIKETQLTHLKIIPSEQNLSGAESEILNRDGRNFILREKLQKLKEDFDYILIDCPPSLTVLTINALTAADAVLIPIQCEFYALEGVSQLMSTIALTKNRLNAELDIEGVVFTMYDSRTNLSQQVIDEVKSNIREYIFETKIPRSVRLAEAPSHGLPINLYDVKSNGAVAYKELAEELIKKNGKKTESSKSAVKNTTRTAGKVTKSGASKRAVRKTALQDKKSK